MNRSFIQPKDRATLAGHRRAGSYRHFDKEIIMKRSTQQTGRLVLIAVVAVCALSAGPALAGGCVANGQAAYQQCIEGMATFFGGELPPYVEASCSEIATDIVNACIQATKPSFEYTVCTQSYSVWLITDEWGIVQSVAVSFVGPWVCQ